MPASAKTHFLEVTENLKQELNKVCGTLSTDAITKQYAEQLQQIQGLKAQAAFKDGTLVVNHADGGYVYANGTGIANTMSGIGYYSTTPVPVMTTTMPANMISGTTTFTYPTYANFPGFPATPQNKQKLRAGDLVVCKNDHPICVVMEDFEYASYDRSDKDWRPHMGFWQQGKPAEDGPGFCECTQCKASYVRIVDNPGASPSVFFEFITRPNAQEIAA